MARHTRGVSMSMSDTGSDRNSDEDDDEAEEESPEQQEQEQEQGEGGEPAAPSPEDEELRKLRLVIRMQAVARKFKARLQLPTLLETRYEKIYDPVQKRCFYYNKHTDTSTWKKPTLLGGSDMNKISSLYTKAEAVLMLQCWMRAYVGKKRVRRRWAKVVKVLKNGGANGKYQNPKSKQNLWELPYFMGGELDHGYSSGDSDDGFGETRKEKRDRIAREKKERALQRKAAKAARKAEKKARKKAKKEGGEDDENEDSGDISDNSDVDRDGSGSDVGSESDSDNSDSDSDSDSDDSYESDGSSVTSEVARERRRLKRTYPRSRAQVLVDMCEDREDKIATLTLNMSGLGATRFTSRIYDLTHITQLILSNNKLLRLNPDVKFLDKLELLDLRNNQLKKVPIELEELTMLKVLLLGGNRLTTYPGNLYKLDKIQTFDISKNRLPTVIVEVGNMALLKDTHEWEVGLGLWKQLEQLNASNNCIGQWPGQVEKVRNLKLLNIANNSLREIPTIIEQNFNLLYLDLSHNKLEVIPPEIYKLRHLETLKISHNNIAEFPPLPAPQVIKDYDDTDVFMTDEELAAQEKALKKNPPKPVEIRFHALVTLDMSYNKFTEIGGCFAAFPKLVLLDMSNNEIASVNGCIGKMTRMKELNLSHNKITTMPKEFALCKTLQTLRLNNNEIVGVPESIQNLTQMRFLYLQNNSILSQSMKSTFFATLGKLVELYCQHNRMVGVPSSFYTLVKLTQCDLSHNKISTIADDIQNMVSLVCLNVSHNQISSTFPEELSALKDLNTLDLQHNFITELPSSLSKMTNLYHVYLEHNCFKEFSTVMRSMSHINGWNFHNNQIYGEYAKYLDSLDHGSDDGEEGCEINKINDEEGEALMAKAFQLEANVPSKSGNIDRTRKNVTKAWHNLEIVLLKQQEKEKAARDRLQLELDAASADLFAQDHDINMGSLDDTNTVHTELTEGTASLLFGSAEEKVDSVEGGDDEECQEVNVEIEMPAYREWSSALAKTILNMDKIMSEPSIDLGPDGQVSGSSGAAQVFKSFIQDSEYKKIFLDLVKHNNSSAETREPFPDHLFTPELMKSLDLGAEYIEPCKKFEAICRDIVLLSEEKVKAYHRNLRNARGEIEEDERNEQVDPELVDTEEDKLAGDAFITGQYEEKDNENEGGDMDNAFIGGQYESFEEASQEMTEEDEAKTAEKREKDAQLQEKLKKIAALKKIKEEGVEVVDAEFLGIEKLIRETRERTQQKRREQRQLLRQSSSMTSSANFKSQASMNSQPEPARNMNTIASETKISHQISRTMSTFPQDINTKWKMADIIFDPFLGDGREEPGLFLCAFDCYYGYGLSLLERAQIITSDIRKIEDCYFEKPTMGFNHEEEVDEEHSGYTSRLGMAHRRGDDLRDILHDFSREPYFPSKVQQGRVAEESVATSKKSRFVFEEVDDGNVDDECKEERDIAMFTDPDLEYIYNLPRATVKAVLDELYIERCNVFVYSTILLAAAGDLLKLLGWDMVNEQAVESENELVLLSAVDLRAKAAGFFFAYGRCLQAVELHSLAVAQFDKVGRLSHHFPPAVMGKFRSCCTMGNYLQAKPLIMPFVLDLLGIKPGSKEDRDFYKRSLSDLLRILMKRNPEIGMLYLYMESHINAIKATGYSNHFQKRVHEVTPSGLLMRPERSYEETKHGNRPDMAGLDEANDRIVREFAEKANKAIAYGKIRDQIKAAMKVAEEKIGILDDYMEEVGPATIGK